MSVAIIVRPAVDADIDHIVDLLLAIQQQTQGEYPPRETVPTPQAARSWLLEYQLLHRLVAVDTSANVVIGHISIIDFEHTHPDLPRWFHNHSDFDSTKFLELTRLFVDPKRTGEGVARELLQAAARIVAGHGATAALCVMDTQEAAIALYRQLGWSELGEFLGESGRINYVFVASPEELDASGNLRRAFETNAIHAGIPSEGPVTLPISISSTYRAPSASKYGRWAYARTANPTRDALEVALTTLENGAGAGAFASGLAAIDTAMRFVPAGGRVVVSNDVYGGTWRLLNAVWRPMGVAVTAVDLADLQSTDAALRDASMLIIETPSNPMLRVFDIASLAEHAHDHGALVLVDNTFATPYLQRPLDIGADLSVHSTTKYLGGHSDVIGGALVAKAQEHADQIHFFQKAIGAVASPFDAFLVLRGIRTLSVRMDRHCSNAMAVAEMLKDHPKVDSVYYPGLPDHDGYDLAQKQMSAAGGMISFAHAEGADAAARAVQRTRLFTLAESLGAVESLIEVPAKMTHAGNAKTPLEVPGNLVRLSVGLEDAGDLIDDLQRALQ